MFREIAHLSGFSLERLASLCEVSEAGSIGQASRGDANRQSLLSRQIAELETVFGVALLARQSRPYRLTSEGRELAQAARQFFQVAGDLRRQANGEKRRVVIGAGEMLIQWLLFPACEAVRREEPQVVFAFKNLDSTRLIDAVQHGEVDVALVRREAVPPGFEFTDAVDFDQVAFIPRKLTAASGPVQAAELSRLPWAVLEGHGHFRMFMEEQAKDGERQLNVAMECSSYTQVAMAVQTQCYAGFLPAFAESAFRGNSRIVQRSLSKSLQYRRSLVLTWKKAHLKSRPFLEPLIQQVRARLCAKA